MAFMAPQNTAHPNARYDDKLNWHLLKFSTEKAKTTKLLPPNKR